MSGESGLVRLKIGVAAAGDSSRVRRVDLLSTESTLKLDPSVATFDPNVDPNAGERLVNFLALWTMKMAYFEPCTCTSLNATERTAAGSKPAGRGLVTIPSRLTQGIGPGLSFPFPRHRRLPVTRRHWLCVKIEER